jgi:2'-5' RNA ligase
MVEEKLYFIAIIPPQPYKEKIAGIKQSFAEIYHVSHALKSPPHITLIPPFKLNESKEKEVTLFLEKFVENATSFQLVIEDYGSFKPRVIFLKPILNELFKCLYESISSDFYTLFPVGKASKRPFHPHLTIAFRDLKPNIFYKAWDELKSKRFKAEFIIDRIFLLKHDGRKWQEFREFIFHHCQLPA